MAVEPTNIISQLQRYEIDPVTHERYYVPFSIGVEQRYVKPIAKSNNNNLEEQLLLGVDSITTAWDDNGVQRYKTEYRRDTDLDNYYVLDSFIYAGDRAVSDAAFLDNEDAVVFEADAVSIVGNVLNDNKGNGFIGYDEINHKTSFSSSVTLKVEKLFYVKDGTTIQVSEKTTGQTLNDSGQKITREIITNNL